MIIARLAVLALTLIPGAALASIGVDAGVDAASPLSWLPLCALGVYGARKTYSLADAVAYAGGGAFLSTIPPSQRGIPDDFRVDFVEFHFNGLLTSTAETTIDIDNVSELMAVLGGLCSSIRIHSTALGEVVESIGLDDCVTAAIAAGLPVTIDTDLPLPGQSKTATSFNYAFVLTVRVPWYDPNIYRAEHCYQCHQFADGGFTATFGAAAVTLGGAAWTIDTTTAASINLIGRRTALAKFSPWNYLQATTSSATDIEFEAGLYAALAKTDESLDTVTDAGQYDLWIDGQKVLVKSDVHIEALLGEWMAARDYDGPGVVRRLLDDEGANIGAMRNTSIIPILWRDPREGERRVPRAQKNVRLELDANFAAAATWTILRAKPMSRIGNGRKMCGSSAPSTEGDSDYAPILIA